MSSYDIMILFYMVPCFFHSNLISYFNYKYFETNNNVGDTLYIILIKFILPWKKHNCEWSVFKSLFIT